MKSYSELCNLRTIEDRFKYLKLDGSVGADTFGYERYLNQKLYTSPEWKSFKSKMIIRDNGCEMGLDDFEIIGNIYLHHINPITPYDIRNRAERLMDPENVICVSFQMHNAIHFGTDDILRRYEIVERAKNDTCPWRK